ncbi:MAG: sensor domain-containing diguanylate cyclase [Lachnospiraceae bacterium]|nr:sensor domain-containing diguanylate cyclase [Lachnospiraceae bacterium]
MSKKTDEKNIFIGNAIRSLYQMIMLVNGETLECHVVDRNQELENLSGFTSFDVFCEGLYKNIHPEDREDFRRFIGADCFPVELGKKVHTSFGCRIRRANRRYFWSEIIFCNATEEDNAGGSDYLFLIRDIHGWKMKELRAEAEQRAALKALQEQYNRLFEENMIDEQTGCYNRKGMKYYTDIVMDEARRTGKHLFVCVADLNGLKHINDTYGHPAGDEAIAAVSAGLLKAAPKGSRIVRMGGDEFLLLAALPADSREPDEMDEKIDRGLEEYNRSHDNQFKVGASYGWVLLPLKDGMTDMDEYIEMADERMYAMKEERDPYRRK